MKPKKTYLDLSDVSDFSVMPDVIVNNLHKLTKREEKYFRMMWPTSGVLYITSKPGIAKSSMARSIAEKLNFRYIDIRLSQIDECDIGLYPSLGEVDDMKCLDHVVPRWAIESNRQPTIIHFEELNRAPLPVRNAALQILLEREIGIDFRFNDTVLMMASGNLGAEDNCDVEEFDRALNNRLIHVHHTLTADEWLESYANEHCHSIIRSYIKNYPERLYQDATENSSAYATPRSWTFLSDYVVKNFGMDANPKDFLRYIGEVAHSYIGNSSTRFLSYCQDIINISIKDVLDRYDAIEKDLQNYNRDKNSELINSLKEMNISKLSDKQLSNLNKFLRNVGEDELTAYVLHVLDNGGQMDERIKNFLKGFKDLLIDVRKYNSEASGKVMV